MSEQTIQRHPEAETHPSGERVVLFHKGTKNSIVLNPTGTWIWEQLATPRSRDWLVAQMAERHPDVEKERLAGDIDSYLQELSQNELIQS